MMLSLTGPSGVGKTTLLKGLLHNLSEARPLLSITTRAPRPSDVAGEYRYVSFDEFERLSQSGVFLWEAKTTTNRYGTRRADIDRALDAGIFIPVLVMDAVKKLNEYANTAGRKDSVIYFYIDIHDEAQLRKRFAERGDSIEETEARIAECRSWRSEAKASNIPFIFLNATQTREEILHNALAHIKNL